MRQVPNRLPAQRMMVVSVAVSWTICVLENSLDDANA